MRIISLILASGVGSRLYPLSTEEKPKQFLKLISDKMIVEDTLERYRLFSEKSYIVTLEKYQKYVENLQAKIVYERERKETATSVFYGINAIKKDFDPKETIVIQTPSDHFVEENLDFIKTIEIAVFQAVKGKFVLIGVKPTRLETDFGYIKDGYEIIEKPSRIKAKKLIENGYFWNTAIYVYRLDRMLVYFDKYFNHEKLSFEKMILPHISSDSKVIYSHIKWEDLGTYERLNSPERWVYTLGKRNEKNVKQIGN